MKIFFGTKGSGEKILPFLYWFLPPFLRRKSLFPILFIDLNDPFHPAIKYKGTKYLIEFSPVFYICGLRMRTCMHACISMGFLDLWISNAYIHTCMRQYGFLHLWTLNAYMMRQYVFTSVDFECVHTHMNASVCFLHLWTSNAYIHTWMRQYVFYICGLRMRTYIHECVSMGVRVHQTELYP
jgi:hypothetical protein